MTYLYRAGLFCFELRAGTDVSHCRVPLTTDARTTQTPNPAYLCRACQRELLWAARRQTRDLKARAA